MSDRWKSIEGDTPDKIATRLRVYISDGYIARWVGGDRADLIGDVSKLEGLVRGERYLKEGTVHGRHNHSYSVIGGSLLISHPQWSYVMELPADDVLAIAEGLTNGS